MALILKTTAAILLLLLLSFNWVGYRLVSIYFENRSDLVLETRIDKAEYDESQLIELRVPLNAPYMSGTSAEFETFHGELELSGIHYKYVKRKVENGELVLLCLPDQDKTRFQNARADFFKLVNDLSRSNTSHSKDKNTNNVQKTFSGDYIQENNFLTLSHLATGCSWKAISTHSHRDAGYVNLPERPPRV